MSKKQTYSQQVTNKALGGEMKRFTNQAKTTQALQRILKKGN